MQAARHDRFSREPIIDPPLDGHVAITVNTSKATFPNLRELVELFYGRVDDLARFEQVDGCELPPSYDRLLNHNHHMTVTVESYHGCPVDVKVLAYDNRDDTYIREILLTTQRDDQVVMFGIVRLHTRYLSQTVRAEIESRKIPLGRVLIEHNVLRRVELGKLWRVLPGSDLQRHFRLDAPKVTFGRTAIIHCDDEPAIELVEIVAPISQS